MYIPIYLLIILLLTVFLIANTRKKILYREGKIYLIRYTIFKCKFFSLKIHKAVMSDPADLHDHPWSYLSLILWGGYWEETGIYDAGGNVFRYNKKKWYKPGSLLFRKGNKAHKLIIPEGKCCISLIFTTKRWREWGFWRNNNWVSHTTVGNVYGNSKQDFKNTAISFIRQRATKEDVKNWNKSNKIN